MKFFKKLITIFVFTFFIFSIATPNVLAKPEDNSNGKILFQNDEITDLGELENRAKLGISDDKDIKINITTNTILESRNATDDKIDSKILYTTSQKLKTTQLKDGSIKDSYVMTTFALSSLNFYDENYDSSYGVKIALRVYYDHKSYTQSSVVYDLYDIISSEGTIVSRTDGRIVLKTLEVFGKNFGKAFLDGDYNSYLGLKSFDDKKTVNYPSEQSWYTLTDGQDRYFYNVSASSSYVASRCRVYLTRVAGGSTWSVDVDFIRGDVSLPF